MLQISDRTRFTGDARIAIIDPDAEQGSQIRARFDQLPVIAVAVASVTEIDPDCEDPSVILVHDHGGNVAQVLRWSMSVVPPRPVVAYSREPKVRRVVEVVKAGASDYLDWPLDAAAIGRIAETAMHESASSIRTRERQGLAKWAIERLSAREREVLVALAQGLTSQQIATDFAISRRTVETHRYNLRRKLGSIRTAEAIRLVFENGLGGTAGRAELLASEKSGNEAHGANERV